MTERPILFSAPMVRALLAGTKTQTRRAIKVQPFDDPSGHGIQWHGGKCLLDAGYGADYLHTSRDSIKRITPKFCPYGQPGDQLWVREAIRLVPDQEPDDGTRRVLSVYGADGALTVADAWPWKRSYLPPMHCPRWLSRITLEITAVRVERLQDISEADAMVEGITMIWPDGPRLDKGPNHYTITIGNISYNAPTAAGVYSMLWEQINGDGSWAANPWVWVVEFRRI